VGKKTPLVCARNNRFRDWVVVREFPPSCTSTGKRKFPDHPESAQEIRFFGAQEIRYERKIGFLKPRVQDAQEIRYERKIGFLKPCVSKVSKKSDMKEKSDFSNRVCPRCPRNPIFGKNRISQTVCVQGAQEIRFLGKIGFLKSRVQDAQEIRYERKIGFLKPCVSKVSKKSDMKEK
jgi:hypothetical protein